MKAELLVYGVFCRRVEYPAKSDGVKCVDLFTTAMCQKENREKDQFVRAYTCLEAAQSAANWSNAAAIERALEGLKGATAGTSFCYYVSVIEVYGKE